MAITKLLAFEAEAEILGCIRTVHFADEELTITGLSLVDAHAVLDALSNGKLVSVAFPVEHDAPRNGATHREAPHPATMAGAPLPEVVTTPASVPVLPTEEAEFADAGASSAEAPPAEEDPFGAPAKPADPLPAWAGGAAPNPATPTVPPPTVPAGGPALPDALAKAKTVVAALHAVAATEGCKSGDVDALIAAAVRLKDEVPALRVVVNLEDRIRRTVEAHPEKVWPAA